MLTQHIFLLSLKMMGNAFMKNMDNYGLFFQMDSTKHYQPAQVLLNTRRCLQVKTQKGIYVQHMSTIVSQTSHNVKLCNNLDFICLFLFNFQSYFSNVVHKGFQTF